MAAHGETRRRMLDAAVAVMREKGAAGVTVDEVLERSGAPRGSVYHHFPGGRKALLSETLDYAGESFTGMLERAAARGSEAVVDRLVAFWTDVLRTSDYRAGCPVIATAVRRSEEGYGVAARAAEILAGWQATIAASFMHAGLPAERARALATTCLAAFDGAVSLCRTTRTLTPLQDVAAGLKQLMGVTPQTVLEPREKQRPDAGSTSSAAQ